MYENMATEQQPEVGTNDFSDVSPPRSRLSLDGDQMSTPSSMTSLSSIPGELYKEPFASVEDDGDSFELQEFEVETSMDTLRKGRLSQNAYHENDPYPITTEAGVDNESLDQIRNLVKSFRDCLKAETEQAMAVGDVTSPSHSNVSTISVGSSPVDTVESRRVKDDLIRAKRELEQVSQREKALQAELVALQRLYEKEVEARRALSDELMAIKGNIRVFVRVRPQVVQSDMERKLGKIINVVDERSVAYIPQGKRYEFDACINDGLDHSAIFERHVAPYVLHVMDGTSCTLVAYGQTGSGKTHTMQGTKEDPGMNIRALERAFEIARSNVKETFVFTLSVLQVYNETLQDLLVAPSEESKNLEIKQHPITKAVYVRGLRKIEVSESAQVSTLLEAAKKRRSVGGHAVNEASSRSHLVVMLEVNDKANLVLIDLAGSERASKTEATGERLRESQYINRSLSALGDVLQSLGEKHPRHHPFRNSKLTYLLQDILSGSSKVAFFACVSPEIDSHSETFCTLNFAERIRRVELLTTAAALTTAKSPPAGVKQNMNQQKA